MKTTIYYDVDRTGKIYGSWLDLILELDEGGNLMVSNVFPTLSESGIITIHKCQMRELGLELLKLADPGLDVTIEEVAVAIRTMTERDTP